MPPTPFLRFFATCARGTEGALRRELVALRVHAPRGENGGVSFEVPFEVGMRVCLHARVAVRVLLELGAFEAGDAASLYAGARAIDWNSWLGPRSTLAVSASVRDSETLTHSGYAALKVKDAVVDAIRDKVGSRPNVSPKDPDVAIFLHLAGPRATLYLDLAGEPLHRRGYRVAMTEAPLKETLAAAVLALGDVPVDAPFVDPMAGSGTLAIEQALRARRIPPGLNRNFGFERWPGHDAARRATWSRLREEARAAILPQAPASIIVRDRFRPPIDAALANAKAAGVDRDITFELGDARAVTPGDGPSGAMVTNPPYGERMGTTDGEDPKVARLKLEGLYRGLSDSFRRFHGWRLVLLCGNPELARALPLRPVVSHRLFNGPLEVRLLRYDIR